MDISKHTSKQTSNKAEILVSIEQHGNACAAVLFWFADALLTKVKINVEVRHDFLQINKCSSQQLLSKTIWWLCFLPYGVWTWESLVRNGTIILMEIKTNCRLFWKSFCVLWNFKMTWSRTITVVIQRTRNKSLKSWSLCWLLWSCSLVTRVKTGWQIKCKQGQERRAKGGYCLLFSFLFFFFLFSLFLCSIVA